MILAELALFWGVTVLHMLRLLSPTRLLDADPVEDAAHLAMGAGMTAMVFHGVPLGVLRIAALISALLGVAFFARARSRGAAGRRSRDAAIGASQASTAYMLATPSHPPVWLPAAVAGVLTLCTVVHGWRLVDSRHGTTAPDADRMLVTLPHLGTVLATAAMAWLVATSWT